MEPLNPRQPKYVSDSPAIIVGGCGRSGTTLLRVMLDSHSQLYCGPESNLFWLRPKPAEVGPRLRWLAGRFDFSFQVIADLFQRSTSHAEFIDRFFAACAQRAGKAIWAEKSPRNVRVIPYIFRHFPNARFVHVLRDGRDVICSLRTHPRHKMVDGQLVELNTCRPIDACLRRWLHDVNAGMAFRDDPRYAAIRYEDLVANPKQTLAKLFEFLGLAWEPAVLRYYENEGATRDASKFPQNPEATRPIYTSAVGRWRRDLCGDDRVYVQRCAGPLLRQLGYEDA